MAWANLNHTVPKTRILVETQMCGHRWRWQRQSCRLLLLCCAVLRLPIGNSGDTSALQPSSPWAASPSSRQAQLLLQTAAARMLMVLTDASLWKSFEQGSFWLLQPTLQCESSLVSGQTLVSTVIIHSLTTDDNWHGCTCLYQSIFDQSINQSINQSVYTFCLLDI